MGVTSSGIDKVRAFELPNGIWGDGRVMPAPRICLVKWRSFWSDKFHQVYVNGGYAGVTADNQQRQMIVHVPSSPETCVRIEVFAVEPWEADIDFGTELVSSAGHSGRIRINLLRDQSLPIGATARIYFDHGTGEIDYDIAFSGSPVKIWPAWQYKAGLGMSRFGLSDFGYDSAAAVGFGKGSFGHGQYGLDADTLEWTSPPMPAGVYRYAVKVADLAGNESMGSEAGPIAVTPAAKPAEELSISSFDKQTNQLVLRVS